MVAVDERAVLATAPRRSVIWALLFLRSALAVVFQALVAGGFLLAGASDPWRASADWWLLWFAAVSVVNLVVLVRCLKPEGQRYLDLLQVSRHQVRKDLLWAVVAVLGAAVAAGVPNIVLGSLLWGNAQTGAAMMFRPVPLAGAYLMLVAFPIVHVMAELPTYFGYVMPRLQSLYGARWWPLFACALVLALQHAFLPTLFDWRYLLWKGLMFVPFALWVGFLILRRPSLMPYLVVMHGLLDLSLPFLILKASL